MGQTHEIRNAKKISTADGNFFIRVRYYDGTVVHFYMSSNGTRTISKGEINTRQLPSAKEWRWAVTLWERPIEDLSPVEKYQASRLAQKLLVDPTFGLDQPQKPATKKPHRKDVATQNATTKKQQKEKVMGQDLGTLGLILQQQGFVFTGLRFLKK